MNDHDEDPLEARLGRWRPADPPTDLMLRLRAAEPPPAPLEQFRRWLTRLSDGQVISHPGWLTATGLAAAATVWFLVVRPAQPVHQDEYARRAAAHLPPFIGADAGVAANSALPGRLATDPGIDRARDASFDVGGFANPDLRYAVLDGIRGESSNGGFYLETPAVPIRLDCGYTVSDGEFIHPLGKFNLNISNKF